MKVIGRVKTGIIQRNDIIATGAALYVDVNVNLPFPLAKSL
jgi:hypothetical protein